MDLLYDFERVQSFYPHAPLEAESFRRAAAAVDYPAASRAEVCTILEEEARSYGAGPASLANIERLRRGAYALVTGQQVGLFGGPVFSFYKALTAIKRADTLTSQGLDTVPVFWLATEDHDLEEVNHAFLLDRDYQVQPMHESAPPPVSHAPVGEVAFSQEIDRLVERAIALLPEGEGATETADLLRGSYRSGETFGSSFARMMARLFGSFGVIVLDPMHPRLRPLARPVFRKALESAGDLYRALDARNRELSRRGYHAQVHVTESTSLLFVRVNGQRTPLRRRNGEFLLHGDRIPLGGLLEELEREPAHFSPNVLLRPVVQDVLLPTIGYVGGPAELAYFAQAGVVYQNILGHMPVVVPRASFTLVDRHAAKLLKRYGLTLPDIFRERQHLRERMALRFLPSGLSDTLSRSEAQLQTMLGELRAELGALDQTLVDATARSGRKMAYQLGRLKEKAARVTYQRNQQVERDANLLQNLLHPRRLLQERVFSGVSFLARFGTPLLDQLYQKVQTDCADHQVVPVGDEG
jgi:bacillithiol biosynthesis cysteine-adding enzyme BshC